MQLSIRENYSKARRKSRLGALIALISLTLGISLPPTQGQNKTVLRAIAPGREKAREAEASQATPAKTKPSSPVKLPVSHSKPRVLGNGFVPPPPPNTPSILNGSIAPGLYSPGHNSSYIGLDLEYLSPSALKEKYEELNSIYKHSLIELERKKNSSEAKRKRALEFADLYKEGVISLRELEAAQREAEVDTSELDMKCKDLKRVLDLLQKKLKENENRRKPARSQEKKPRINKLSPKR
jgi:hypothetical protein